MDNQTNARAEIPASSLESPKPASPTRPYQMPRSISEISSPAAARHLSARDEKPPQPAAVSATLRASIDTSRPLAATPSISPTPSRRPSIVATAMDKSGAIPASSKQHRNGGLPLSDGVPGLEPEKIEGLRKSLIDLAAFSKTTTGHLDDTYYSVLEKLATLQSNILAIKEIAGLSRDVKSSLQSDGSELIAETNSQLDGFGHFRGQQSKIEALQARIIRGRSKMKSLSQRLDAVGDRIDGWEKADKEWQERTRRRLKVTWIVISVIALALALLSIFAQLAPHSTEVDGPLQQLPFLNNEQDAPGTDAGSNRTGMNFRSTNTDRDDQLRVFDEL